MLPSKIQRDTCEGRITCPIMETDNFILQEIIEQINAELKWRYYVDFLELTTCTAKIYTDGYDKIPLIVTGSKETEYGNIDWTAKNPTNIGDYTNYEVEQL